MDMMMKMKYYYVILLLLVSCGSGATLDNGKSKLTEAEAEVLLEVFDSLGDLENLEDVKKSNRAFAYALHYMDQIWEPLYKRMALLAKPSMVGQQDVKLRPKDESEAVKLRNERKITLQKYQDLRRSLVKLLKRKTDDRGVQLLIHHLAKDLPEGKEFLEMYSGKSYGYDVKAWKKWMFSRQMNSLSFKKQEMIDTYRQSNDVERLKTLKFLLQKSADRKVEAGAFDDFKEKLDVTSPLVISRRNPERMKGILVSQKSQLLKMVAVVIFLEALNDRNRINQHFGILGLKQLVKVAEEALVEHIKQTGDATMRSRLIAILAEADNSRVAEKMIQWSNNPSTAEAALSALGTLRLNKKESKVIADILKERVTLFSKKHRNKKLLAYVALINMGEKGFFLDLLKTCPEKKFSSNYIYDPDLDNFEWLQLRRVLKNEFSRLYPEEGELTKEDGENETSGKIDKDIKPANERTAKFRRYIQYHNLNFDHANWRKWFNTMILGRS
jgi:hypothetical protein